MNEERLPFDSFELVYAYTTQDALDDGVLVDAATHPDLRVVTLLNWNTERIRIIVSSGLLALLQDAGNVSADWQEINRQLVRHDCQPFSDFAELKLRIGDNDVTIWIGCEPFGPGDPMPKLTFYLPEEH
jgi:hypothetical protein